MSSKSIDIKLSLFLLEKIIHFFRHFLFQTAVFSSTNGRTAAEAPPTAALLNQSDDSYKIQFF